MPPGIPVYWAGTSAEENNVDAPPRTLFPFLAPGRGTIADRGFAGQVERDQGWTFGVAALIDLMEAEEEATGPV
jgi:hypothetical protein